MTNEQNSFLLLKDHGGEYFLVPQATLEEGRVPVEHKAEVERLMAEAAPRGGADGDVQGFLVPFPFLLIVGDLTFVGGAIGYFAAKGIIDSLGR